MFFLYEQFQKLIYSLLFIVSKFFNNVKFKRFCEIRTSDYFFKELEKTNKNWLKIKTKGDIPIFWFHVASAGEMEQAIPVARKLHEKMNAYFLLTYYSPSAEPFIKNFPALIGAFALPIDKRKYYSKIFQSIPIRKLFFVRYDIWPSLFYECKKFNIQVNLISASLSKTKRGILGYISKIWNRKFYKKFSHIFAVTKDDVDYFCNYLPKNKVHFAGDAKWARAYERANLGFRKKQEKSFSCFFSFCLAQREILNKKNIVFGSPHKEEHQIALQCAIIKEKIFIVYVPHDISGHSCQKIIDDFYSLGSKAILYSELINKLEEEYSIYSNNIEYENTPNLKVSTHLNNIKKEIKFSSHTMSCCDVVVVDKIGFLAEIYEIGDIAIIGGGFDGQIHNVLEAAAHAVPVIIGNLFLRAREAKELVSAGGAISFQNTNELFQFLTQWVSLEEQGTDSTHPARRLAQSKSRTLELFRSIPDTSEIVLQALLKEQ